MSNERGSGAAATRGEPEKYTRVLFPCNVHWCGCGSLLFLAGKVRRVFLVEEKVRHDLFELLVLVSQLVHFT
jgi:hypothetical protein